MAKKKKKRSKAAAVRKSWRNDNVAHTSTWAYLFFMTGEIEIPFVDARDTKISEFEEFWNPVASPAMQVLLARAFAAEMNVFFVGELAARYSNGEDFGSAVIKVGDILANGDNTVCDLAHEIDNVYHFAGEV